MYIADKNKFNNVKIYIYNRGRNGATKATYLIGEAFIESTISELTKNISLMCRECDALQI